MNVFQSQIAVLSCATSLACSITAATDWSAEADGVSHDALYSRDSFSIACKSAAGIANLQVLERNGAFEVIVTQAGRERLRARNLRPSLNTRVSETSTIPPLEFIDFVEAGLDAPPVDGAKVVEIDLYSSLQGTYSRRVTVRDASTSIELACRYGSEALLRATRLHLISDVDMEGVSAVGFDIDDTLAFTTPTFARAFLSGGTPKPEDSVFWTLANGCDSGCQAQTLTLADGSERHLPSNEPSTAKLAAVALVARHKALGHRVFAITARPDTNGNPLRAYIQRELGIAEADVYFEPDLDLPGNPKGKTDRIESLNLDLFYGDSDSDIRDAAKAFAGPGGSRTKEVRSVRFLRAPQSSNRKAGKLNKYHPGYFGEAILRGSYY
jgi:acid phosphatase class B